MSSMGIDEVGKGTLQSNEISFGCLKPTPHTHSVEVKTPDLIVETLPTFSVNILLKRSSFEKSFGLFEVYIIFLNKSYFFFKFHD